MSSVGQCLLLGATLTMPEPSRIMQAKQESLTFPAFLTLLTLFAFFLVAFLSVTSGTIASSDGVTVFNVTQALVERGEIAVKGDNVAEGVGGRLYSRYGIGLSLAAIPFYLLGKAMSLFSPAHLDPLVLKGAVSITNAAIGALVCSFLFLAALGLGYSQGVAFLLTVAFAFSTFFIVYATKSFLTQPLETLSMLGSIYYLVKSRDDGICRRPFYAGLFAGVGILTKWFFVINLPILTTYLLITSVHGRRVRDLVFFQFLSVWHSLSDWAITIYGLARSGRPDTPGPYPFLLLCLSAFTVSS